MKNLRAKKKKEEENKTAEDLEKILEKRRAEVRDRVRKHRQQQKGGKSAQNDNESQHEIASVSGNSSLTEIVSESYSNIQTLGKAVKKVSRALPASPRKKKAILTHIVAHMDEAEKEQLVCVVTKSTFTKKSAAAEQNSKIRKFYERDDISRVSPNTKDVKKYTCPETEQELFLPTRHMVLSLKEAYALFVEENKNVENGKST